MSGASEWLVRFVTEAKDPRSHREQGLIQALASLRDRGRLSPDEEDAFGATMAWFDDHLRVPWRFTRPGRGRTIHWFRSSARDCIDRMRALAAILEDHGVPTKMIRTRKPGYMVYEDRHQVGAVPFQDTV